MNWYKPMDLVESVNLEEPQRGDKRTDEGRGVGEKTLKWKVKGLREREREAKPKALELSELPCWIVKTFQLDMTRGWSAFSWLAGWFDALLAWLAGWLFSYSVLIPFNASACLFWSRGHYFSNINNNQHFFFVPNAFSDKSE